MSKQLFVEKFASDNAPRLLVENFISNYERYLSGYQGLISETDIEPVGALPHQYELNQYRTAGMGAIKQTVMLKLNGGLGTSMGLESAKSLLPVKKGLSFLDILAQQVVSIRNRHYAPLPLLMMNSFNTDADTLASLSRHIDLIRGQQDIPLSFLQHRIPRIDAQSQKPVSWPQDVAKEWCPPGHGDIYLALITSGLMDVLLDRGFKYVFVSNCDNLGATINLQLLGYFATKQSPFMMEVTERTEADRKGGHLARMKNGPLVLREIAQCPPEQQADFQNIERHSYFNTNNLWLNLPALKAHMAKQHGRLDLPVIVNRKTVDPRDKQSTPVVQLETAMGAAIGIFEGSCAVRVPRTRFSPVKTTNDLLGLWSDAFNLTEDGHIVLSTHRRQPPLIKLDPAHYGVIDDFLSRFPKGAPSLLKCDSLEIQGNFLFGGDISIEGKVVLKSDTKEQKLITDGTVLKG
jgi:UTP--glucose-1-phosphate uridylyltransferase